MDYANTSLRMGSPASSIGSVHTEDQTSPSDLEDNIGDLAFEKKWEQRIGLHDPRKEEQASENGPKIDRPEAGSEEEKALVAQILRSLRQKIKELNDDELFERAMLRGSQIAFEHHPQTSDIDAIMRSMMPAPTANGITHSNGPNNAGPKKMGRSGSIRKL